MRTMDRALLTLLVLAAAARTAAPQTATINVDASADQHPIDPAVYGLAYATQAQLQDLRITAHRRGGNNTSRYNWQLNADNRGNDWYYQSIAYQSASPGDDVDDFIAETRAGGSEPMVTIPMVGWVAKLGPNRSKLASFSAAKYGAQTACDWQWYPDACNGILASNGQFVQNNDKNDANVPANGAFHDGWFDHLVTRWGTAANGGLRYYILDNEYSIWHATHRDVHPVGAGMDEIRDRMVDFATRIKDNDPGALVMAPEEWGWLGYLLSGYDQQWAAANQQWNNTPDRVAHGGWDYVPWLLDQMRLREVATGRRLLDVFSLHYYPQGGEFGDDVSTAMQQRRNRSTRSLWDPDYVDETWINDRVRLIPRMRQWVAQHYPNTRTAITEYNWGAEGHINGATTQADILGIFGREGLDIGARWTTPDTATPTYKAIKMYRNYDGAGGAFGNVSVRATAADPDNLSAFAARRTADGALTVMLVAKRLSGATATTVNLAGFQAAGPVQVWRLSASNAITHLPDVTAACNSVTLSLPAQSITLLIFAPQAQPFGTLALGDVSVPEGNAGTVSATFSVVRTGGACTTATVSYATQNGTATAGSDYVAASGTLTFGPSDTSLPVSVAVNGDTVDEPNERFVLRLSAPSGATIGQPDGWATIVDDDGGSPLLEIAHGVRGRHDFASGPDHLYVLRQDAYSSYEVVVDGAFGRGGSPTGAQLDRLAADGATVLQFSIATGTGRVRRLRWLNDSSTPQAGEYVRVRSGSCNTDCTAGDGYRLRTYDTTYRIARFNNSGSQVTVLLLQNPTTRSAIARARFWSPSGALLYSHSFTLGPRSANTLLTWNVFALAGQAGSITVASDAGYGELTGKAVAVEPSSGFAFDTPMVPRAR
jgi:hypothetical protein